ncbi:hypothetical protein [Calothrix sp. NIES-3974]|uniref:hypothetical protein n=1 Tax=Calothrix sp. NIES-3974 TaxID=2005462 RepID=UPI0012FDD6CA|nr:hypothetical protein [Calothrix sp. NIES-3974]
MLQQISTSSGQPCINLLNAALLSPQYIFTAFDKNCDGETATPRSPSSGLTVASKFIIDTTYAIISVKQDFEIATPASRSAARLPSVAMM